MTFQYGIDQRSDRKLDDLRRARDRSRARITVLEGAPDLVADPILPSPSLHCGVQDRAKSLDRIVRKLGGTPLTSRARAASASMQSTSTDRRDRAVRAKDRSKRRAGGTGRGRSRRPCAMPRLSPLGATEGEAADKVRATLVPSARGSKKALSGSRPRPVGAPGRAGTSSTSSRRCSGCRKGRSVIPRTRSATSPKRPSAAAGSPGNASWSVRGSRAATRPAPPPQGATAGVPRIAA